MPVDRPDLRRPLRAVPRLLAAAALAAALLLAACELLESAPAKPAEPAPAPAAPPPPPPPAPPADEPKTEAASTADFVARRLLAYNERLQDMSSAELAAEITRLDSEVAHTSSAGAPDVVLDQALALARERGPGDLARASGLLEAIIQAQSVEMQPWQPLARLLAASIDEQRRLEDQLDQQAAQRRDTQRQIQQLTEKLEALKAIERSMTERSMSSRSAAAPRPAAPAGAGSDAPPAGARAP